VTPRTRQEIAEIIEQIQRDYDAMTGHDQLWQWFGLSRASFLVLPRVLMHEMPDDWQRQMAKLLNEHDEAFPCQPDIGSTVRATNLAGKLVPMPEYLVNYRHPDRSAIDRLRGKL
jgi:hypothetical protein